MRQAPNFEVGGRDLSLADQKKSFWTTVPGILTGIAAIITAITGLTVALYSAGFFSPGNSTGTLATPTLLSPTNGKTSFGFLVGVNFQWTSVTGATHYDIEIECWYNNGWREEHATEVENPEYQYILSNPDRPSGVTNFRWRVWASDDAGSNSPKTDWWYYNYPDTS